MSFKEVHGRKTFISWWTTNWRCCGFEQIVRNTLSDVPNLHCDHEEADDRLMLRTADAVRYGNEKLSQHHLIPIFSLLH